MKKFIYNIVEKLTLVYRPYTKQEMQDFIEAGLDLIERPYKGADVWGAELAARLKIKHQPFGMPEATREKLSEAQKDLDVQKACFALNKYLVHKVISHEAFRASITTQFRGKAHFPARAFNYYQSGLDRTTLHVCYYPRSIRELKRNRAALPVRALIARGREKINNVLSESDKLWDVMTRENILLDLTTLSVVPATISKKEAIIQLARRSTNGNEYMLQEYYEKGERNIKTVVNCLEAIYEGRVKRHKQNVTQFLGTPEDFKKHVEVPERGTAYIESVKSLPSFKDAIHS